MYHVWGRGVYRVLVRKHEEKRPLGRPRHRWEDNIKMDLLEVEWEGAWTGLIWFRIGTDGGLLWVRQWTFGVTSRKAISSTYEWFPDCKNNDHTSARLQVSWNGKRQPYSGTHVIAACNLLSLWLIDRSNLSIMSQHVICNTQNLQTSPSYLTAVPVFCSFVPSLSSLHTVNNELFPNTKPSSTCCSYNFHWIRTRELRYRPIPFLPTTACSVPAKEGLLTDYHDRLLPYICGIKASVVGLQTAAQLVRSRGEAHTSTAWNRPKHKSCSRSATEWHSKPHRTRHQNCEEQRVEAAFDHPRWCTMHTVTHSALLTIVYCLANSFYLRHLVSVYIRVLVQLTWRWPIYEVETSGQTVNKRKKCAVCDRKYRYTLLEARDPAVPNNQQQHTECKTVPENR